MFTSELKYPQYDSKLKHNYKIPSIYGDLNDLNPNAIKSPKPLAKKSDSKQSNENVLAEDYVFANHISCKALIGIKH